MKTISQLKKEAWKQLSIYYRLKYPVCQICEKRTSAVHHIITRGAGGNILYFDEQNLIALCFDCHIAIHIWKNNYVKIIKEIKGQDIFEKLNNLKHKSKKFTRIELIEITKQYKIKEYE